MPLSTVSPEKAKQLFDSGAIIVDLREADEHAREKIAGARHLPLSKLEEAELPVHRGNAILFHCKSGARTRTNASRLARKVDETCDAYIVEGGLDALKNAGLPVVTDRKQPIELQRQVQIGAGGLAFVGTLLGLLVSPWFFVIPLGVGAGLLTAGITGFCGMAQLLVHMPWNRVLWQSR